MDDEKNLTNIKNSSDCSGVEERQLLIFSTPTSSCTGHEKYIDKLLNNPYEDDFDIIDLDILHSKCNIFDENNYQYIHFTSKNDKLIKNILYDVNTESKKICNTTTTDDPVGLVPASVDMEKSFTDRNKNKKQKSTSRLNHRPTVASRKTRIMSDKPVSTETVTVANTVTSYNSRANDDDIDSTSENYNIPSCGSSNCSDSKTNYSRITTSTNASSTNNDDIEARLYLLINIVSMKLSVNDYEKYWSKCYKRENCAYTEERNYCFKQIIDEIESCLHKLDGERHILPVNIFKNIRPVSKETKDGNDNKTFLRKREFIRKNVQPITVENIEKIIDSNLLFSVHYSLFTYYKFGKNMKQKISPDKFFTVISSMLYEIGETTFDKQVMIIIWSVVYIFAYTIAINRNDESLENKVTGDNIHNTVSKHMIFEPVSNFVQFNSDGDSRPHSSENEFVSGTNTTSTNTTSNGKNKKGYVCDNNIEPDDAKCKEAKVNNKSTNIRRNKTCRPSTNTGSTGIEDIKMDKSFIIDKYIKDINNINQCESFNNILTYPAVEPTHCVPVMKDATTSSATKTTDSTLISCDAATASSSNNTRPIIVNIIATNNNFNNDTKQRTYSVYDKSEKLKDVISELYDKNNLSLSDNIHSNKPTTAIPETTAGPETVGDCVKIKNDDAVKVEKGNKLLSTENYDDGIPNADFMDELKIYDAEESISENIETIVIDDDSDDLSGSKNKEPYENNLKQSSKLISSSNSEKLVVSLLKKTDEEGKLLRENKLVDGESVKQNNKVLIPVLIKIKMGGKGSKGIRRKENDEEDDDDGDDEEEDDDDEEDDSDDDDGASSTNATDLDTDPEENEVNERYAATPTTTAAEYDAENEGKNQEKEEVGNESDFGEKEVDKNIENNKCVELKKEKVQKKSCGKMAGYLKYSKNKDNYTVEEKDDDIMDNDFSNDKQNKSDDNNMDQDDINYNGKNENRQNQDPDNNYSNGNNGNGSDGNGDDNDKDDKEKYSKNSRGNDGEDGEEEEEEEGDDVENEKDDGNDESGKINNLKVTNKETIICMDVDCETICIDDDFETICIDEDCEERVEEKKLQTTTKVDMITKNIQVEEEKLQTTTVDMRNKNIKQYNTSSTPFVVPSAELTETITVKPKTQTNNIIPVPVPLFEINDSMKINNTIFKLSSDAFECKTSFKTAASSYYAKCINSRLVQFNKNYLIQPKIDQICCYINESILPMPGFEDSEDYLIKRAMKIAAEELKRNDTSSKTAAAVNSSKDTANDNTSIPVETTSAAKKYYDAKKKILVKKYKNNILYNKYVYVYDVNYRQKNMRNENMINKSDLIKDLIETTLDLVDFLSTLTGENNFGQYTTLSESFKLSDISLLDYNPVEENKNYLFNGDEILMSFKQHVNSTADHRPSVFHSLFVPTDHLNVHTIFNSMYNVCKEIVKTNMNKNDIISAYYVEMLFMKHFKTFFKDEEFEQYTKTGSTGNIETDELFKSVESLLPNKIFESYGKCSFTYLSDMLRMWTSYGIVETIIMKLSSIIHVCLSKISAHAHPDPKLHSREEVAEAITRGLQAFENDMHVYGNIIIEPVKHLIEHMWKESQLFTFLLFGISVVNTGVNINFSHLSQSVYWIASHNIVEVGKFNNMYKLSIAISLPVIYYFNLFQKCRDDSTHFFSSTNTLAETPATTSSAHFYNPVKKYISQLYLSENDCDVVMIATKETTGVNEEFAMFGSNSYSNTVNKSSDEEFELKDDERSCYDTTASSSHSSSIRSRLRKRVIVSKKDKNLKCVRQKIYNKWGDCIINTIVGGGNKKNVKGVVHSKNVKR